VEARAAKAKSVSFEVDAKGAIVCKREG